MPHDYFALEAQRAELIGKTLKTSSSTLRVFQFYNYFSGILKYNDGMIEDAFLKEFIEDYLFSLSKFDVTGTEPAFVEKLIAHLNELKDREILSSNVAVLSNIISYLGEQRIELLSILNGRKTEESSNQKAYFPLIDRDNIDGFYGIIDFVTVRISKSSLENKFIIVPSEREIDSRIIDQCKTSWELAVEILKQYVRNPYKYCEIIISFEKKEGYYEGDSLGTALTISFIEQLMNFYNPVYSLAISSKVAFTGSVSKDGKITAIGSEIIKQKTAAVFYSDIKTFVFPKAEENNVSKEINELKYKYPCRELKLIPIEDINDVLSRRNLVEIKKRNLAVRAGKFITKNWISAATVVMLTFLFTLLFAFDFDDNPQILYTDGTALYVKNKNGRVLWNIKVNLEPAVLSNNELLKNYARIVDIDNDHQNEIIFVQTVNDAENLRQDKATVVCYRKNREIIWEYNFHDTVYSERENLEPLYNVFLVDTATIYNSRVLICYANNETSFSSAIFTLKVSDGKRIDKTLWNSGYTWDGMVIEQNNTGEKIFIGAGADNGYNDGVIWGISLENMNGFRPTIKEYQIKNLKEADLLFYIRISKNDYEKYVGARTPGMLPGTLKYDKINGIIKFISLTDGIGCFHYSLHSNLHDFDISVTDKFRMVRDSLVSAGILNTPYTDTKEYIRIQKDKLLYMVNNKWVNGNHW